MSVCLFVCQQVACDVVTVYSRSESPCHVNLSQSNRYRSVRSTGRSISHNSPVSFSISLSVSVGACTKEQHPPTRDLTSAVRSSCLVDLFSISSFHPLNLLRAHTTCPRCRFIPWRSHLREDRSADSRTGGPCPLDRTCVYRKTHRTNPRWEISRRWARAKSRDRESAQEVRRSTMKKAEKVGRKGGRCTDDRPGFLERS